MIKYVDTEKVLIEKIKRMQYSVVCDVCGKEIISTRNPDKWNWNSLKYFDITTGHHDWGNESIESVDHYDVCPSCVDSFIKDYLEESKGSITAYININSKISFPNTEYSSEREKGTWMCSWNGGLS